MPDKPKQKLKAVFTVFEMKNGKGYFVPPMNVRYDEKDSDISWIITCGGRNAYLIRTGNDLTNDWEHQAADSHFGIGRVVCALFISGAGLFTPEMKGRFYLHFDEKLEQFSWLSNLDVEKFPNPESANIHKYYSDEKFADWYRAICTHTPIRRAIEDAVLALRMPTESFVFIYRGFEWLEDGLKISKKEMAESMGVKEADLKNLGKNANVETGMRHATKSGVKICANLETYGTWVTGLLEAVNVGRRKLDPKFTPMTTDEIAHTVAIAASEAYP